MTLTPQGVGFARLVGCQVVEDLKNGLSGFVHAFFVCVCRRSGGGEPGKSKRF